MGLSVTISGSLTLVPSYFSDLNFSVESRIRKGKNTKIIIIDNFCMVLFSGVQKLTVLYNILQHFLSEKKIEGNMFKKVIHI